MATHRRPAPSGTLPPRPPARGLPPRLRGGRQRSDRIGRQWQAWLPDAEFVAPHAPDRCAQAPTGRQWFPLTMRDRTSAGAASSGPGRRWTPSSTRELARPGLDDGKLALVGFSQGTMMALHAGLRRPRARPRSSAIRGCWSAPSTSPRRGARPPAARRRAAGSWRRRQRHPGRSPVRCRRCASARPPSRRSGTCPSGSRTDRRRGLNHGGQFLAQSFGRPTPR